MMSERFRILLDGKARLRTCIAIRVTAKLFILGAPRDLILETALSQHLEVELPW